MFSWKARPFVLPARAPGGGRREEGGGEQGSRGGGRRWTENSRLFPSAHAPTVAKPGRCAGTSLPKDSQWTTAATSLRCPADEIHLFHTSSTPLPHPPTPRLRLFDSSSFSSVIMLVHLLGPPKTLAPPFLPLLFSCDSLSSGGEAAASSSCSSRGISKLTWAPEQRRR